ncbi:hypothetical protein F3J31_13735 [Enterobacter sp. Acro-832]|nr:hypothetical protein [Enterobacter sp. Acro-832]
MQKIFRDMHNLHLPRTTAEQIRKGTSVARGHLKTGDLVFFRSGVTQRHVGVYLGEDRFMHASASEGSRFHRCVTRTGTNAIWQPEE